MLPRPLKRPQTEQNFHARLLKNVLIFFSYFC